MDSKQKQAIRSKRYYEKNKLKMKENAKLWRENNQEQYLLYLKNYRDTEKSTKGRRIGHWKNRGVICDDWNVLYDKYINTSNCEKCGILLTYDKKQTKTTKHLDHDHNTGLFRNILCMVCNTHRE